jgi:hypothetical protein
MDGDGNVVLPSALAMSNDDAKRWWVNLDQYNNTLINSFPGTDFLRTGHADILEIKEVTSFILKNLITKEETELPTYIRSTMPDIEQSGRLAFTLHSPLSLSAIDASGGVVSEQTITISGAHYARYGEIQKLSIPKGIDFTLILSGEEGGSFTLRMEEFTGNDSVANTTFSAIPSSANTLATITFTGGSLENSGALTVDYDGNGITDLTYTPLLGETVFVPDSIKISKETPMQSIGMSIGRVGIRPQLLDSPADLSIIVHQLQLAVTTLTILKGQIPDNQHKIIANQLSIILDILLTRLIEVRGYN